MTFAGSRKGLDICSKGGQIRQLRSRYRVRIGVDLVEIGFPPYPAPPNLAGRGPHGRNTNRPRRVRVAGGSLTRAGRLEAIPIGSLDSLVSCAESPSPGQSFGDRSAASGVAAAESESDGDTAPVESAGEIEEMPEAEEVVPSPPERPSIEVLGEVWESSWTERMIEENSFLWRDTTNTAGITPASKGFGLISHQLRVRVGRPQMFPACGSYRDSPGHLPRDRGLRMCRPSCTICGWS